MVGEKRIILKNAGRIDPAKISDYISAGGYKSAGKAIEMAPSAIFDTITKAGLRVRSGSGFPAGVKLKYLAGLQSSSKLRYLVCNADDGEPGTIKDNHIIENDPHLLIEGIIIAAHAIGAEKAFICMNGDYLRSEELIGKAIKEATEHGFIGSSIFGTGISFSVEIKRGTGSILCGDELTLAESGEEVIEPARHILPFTVEKALFNDPTLTIDVETLANIPAIIQNGPEWYTSLGTRGSPGTKIITISGDVANPGFYEIEFGMSLREIIFGLAGGMEGEKKFKAVITGGTAGTFLNGSAIDTPFTWETFRDVGAIMGSGSLAVMNEERYIPEMTLSILRYFSDEKCGKCTSCRIGNKVLSDGLYEMITSRGEKGFGLDRLLMEAQYLVKTSLCPLGQSTVIPLQSLKRYFENEFRFDSKESFRT
jgi:NADP-reducing hydrogenase subunit HndC